MAVSNIGDLKLEEITEEFLQEEMIDMGAELGIDVRQGSLYRDAGEGHAFRTAKFFNDLRQVVDIISIFSCTGDVLDEHLFERGLERNPPEDTPAIYYVEFIGAEPESGARMICEEHFFTVEVMEDGSWGIVSEETGSEMNNIAPGSVVVPERDIRGLKSARVISLAIPAVDRESDDDARRRLQNKLSGPDENGNISQMMTWCESVPGVGRARIIPLWNGPNTVKCVIIAADGVSPTEEIVEAVQEYLDPGENGMGEGVATIGQICTVVAAEPVVIDVSVTVFKNAEGTYAAIQEEFRKELEDYFKSIALENYSSNIKVRYTRIGAALTDIENVIDYDNLSLNGMTENISFSISQIPVLGEVTIHEDIS
ncbi:MAG TPA: baseplate J/gp47 family protein [Candidatus Blautia faecipullorum]|nr:baseplate J/gp47 family protein [Candidatus Blautia faecipullorum]